MDQLWWNWSFSKNLVWNLNSFFQSLRQESGNSARFSPLPGAEVQRPDFYCPSQFRILRKKLNLRTPSHLAFYAIPMEVLQKQTHTHMWPYFRFSVSVSFIHAAHLDDITKCKNFYLGEYENCHGSRVLPLPSWTAAPPAEFLESSSSSEIPCVSQRWPI